MPSLRRLFPHFLLAFAAELMIDARGSQHHATVPRRYLVSLNRRHSESIGAFEAHLNNLGVAHRIVLDMTHQVPDVFHGASLELFEDDHLKYLEGSEHVEKVSRVRLVRRSAVLNPAILEAPLNVTPSDFPPQVQTRVSELHKMGIYGDGVKIAIIDSGVDCTHPALGNGFGPGFKISFGRSYVEDDDDSAEEGESTKPDHKLLDSRSQKKKSDKIRDPCTPCSAHGTHVTGIIGASDVGYGFMGVAPNATLGMYRVFGCNDDSGTTNDMILAAILQAHKDGADIITASIGGPGGWAEGEDWMKPINKLVREKGAIITVAAGNEGSEGLFFGDSPASSDVISVGSVDADAIVAGNFRASTGKQLTMYRTNTFNITGEFPIYITGNSTDNLSDACEELPKSTPNLTDYVVLIQRGTCLFSLKAKHAAAKGAKQILFYMNSTVIITLANKYSNASVAPISLDDGQYIFDQARKDPSGFKVSFPPTKHFYLPAPKGGLPSNFSQYGPSFDFKSPQPAVDAVGGNVVSTYPMKDGGYASLSGTSMATPQLAGIAALILGARGKVFDGYAMRARLATTTKLLDSPVLHSGLDTVVHQGGGLSDAFCAVWTNTTISASSLVLRDSASFRGDQRFTITNNGSSVLNYVLDHRPARTVFTFSNQSLYHRPDDIPTSSDISATVEMNPQVFNLAPGSSQDVQVNFTPPETLDPAMLPVYSGYIVMNADADCESHNVPYYGVLGSLKELPIIDRGPNPNQTAAYPFLKFKKKKPSHPATSKNGTETQPPSVLNHTFVWDLKEHNATELYYRTLFGSPLIRVDVMRGDAVLSNASHYSNFEQTFRGVPLIGLVPDSDGKANPRSATNDSWVQSWNATIVTKEKKKPHFLPNASYKILLRALRVTGCKENEADFEYWVSPQFQLRNSPA